MRDILKNYSIDKNVVENYGAEILKVKECPALDNIGSGKVILVTAITPTKYGEGKTTMNIGLSQALNLVGKKAVSCLREPSLAPVFGVKGGATGGGKCQILPSNEINLHFTGDMHAIGAAQNLICAMLDNHIFHKLSPKVQEGTALIKRAIDISDRTLRDKFELTAACELMAIVCLSKNLTDLRERISRMVIAYTELGEEVTPETIGAVGAVMSLLKDAFRPNLVRTTENTLAIVHGGPFANIAHGCNSVRATTLGTNIADYVVTEAGFGSDLGAEKFFDIKCKQSGIEASAVVIVATIKAMLGQGSMEEGLWNLGKHINSIRCFGLPFVVCLNKNKDDCDKDIDKFIEYCSRWEYEFSICEAYEKGGEGAIDLAYKVIDAATEPKKALRPYREQQTLEEKIESLCRNIYYSTDIIFSPEAKIKLDFLQKDYGSLDICVAKTPMSITTDQTLLGKVGELREIKTHIRDVSLRSGAGFIVVYTGSVVTLPGLPERPSACDIV